MSKLLIGIALCIVLLAVVGGGWLVLQAGQNPGRAALAELVPPTPAPGQPTRRLSITPGVSPTAKTSGSPTRLSILPTRTAIPATRTTIPATRTALPGRTLLALAPTEGAALSREDELLFSEMYSGGGPRGLILSDKLKSLDGKRMDMTGFMAPPLKPALDFFVLTRVPLALCPFCASDAEWPEDIVFVRMPPDQFIKPTSARVKVTGRLEVGNKTDEATGFVSLVRIIAERVEILR